MKALVLGKSGQLAVSLDRRLRLGGCEVVCAGRDRIDLAAPDAVARLIGDVRPDVVINAAAYTAVDRAETDGDLAQAVNATGAGLAARAAADHGLPLIHVSTDYVFNGRKGRPYVETDPLNPLGVYGRTKAEGEVAVARENPRHVILRASWIYAAHGANFFLTMLRLAREREEIGVVADQIGSPTAAHDLADAIARVAARLTRPDPAPDPYGVFHVAGGGSASWFDFATAIMERAGAQGLPSAVIRPLRTDQYPTTAVRPHDTRLDCGRLASVYGLKLPDWRESLDATFDQIEKQVR